VFKEYLAEKESIQIPRAYGSFGQSLGIFCKV